MIAVETFLSAVFDKPLRRFNLSRVRLLVADRNKQNDLYYRFVGVIECELPQELLALTENSDEKSAILTGLKRIANDMSIPKVYRKKLTRKLTKGKVIKKWTFNYFFEIEPSTLVDYTVSQEKNCLGLHVIGYGKFT